MESLSNKARQLGIVYRMVCVICRPSLSIVQNYELLFCNDAKHAISHYQ